MKPVNYFRSREFSTALKVGFTNAVGAALLAAQECMALFNWSW